MKKKPALPVKVATLSAAALANVLDQSVDCVKFIGRDGDVQYMNSSGMCALEIDDFAQVAGRAWADFWPVEARGSILDAYEAATLGETSRFRAFCPTLKGSARWWDVTVSGVIDEEGEHAGFLAISRDVTDNQQGRDALDIAAAELRHRLKNTYTMIASLLIGFARGNDAHLEFARQMSERLVGLGRAQALFTNDDAPCRLDELVEALVVPFSNEHCSVEILDLPDFTINQGRADAIALVVGELTVNSSKHGAIKHGGVLKVCGRTDENTFSIVWDETSTHPVERQSRVGGQGLSIIERIMRARNGTIDMAWRDYGLDVTLTFAQ